MWQAIAVVAAFLALVAVGLLFVNRSLYKEEGKDPVVQVTLLGIVLQYTLNTISMHAKHNELIAGTLRSCVCVVSLPAVADII